MLLALSFFVGGLVSYPASKHLGFHAVIVNISVLSVTGIAACYNIVKQYGISVLDSMFGTEYKWEKVFLGLDMTSVARIHELLEKIRWSGDGVVTEEGLGGFVKQQGLHVNKKYLGILIEQADADVDGCLSREEVLKILLATKAAIEASRNSAVTPSPTASVDAKDLSPPMSTILPNAGDSAQNGWERSAPVSRTGVELVPLTQLDDGDGTDAV